MNEFLANIYNTASNIGAQPDLDTEKLAQAQLLDEMLSQQGIDVAGLDADTITKVASDLFGESNLLGGEDPDADAKAKLAEADTLGRTMAHAYVDELAKIEKQASDHPAAADLHGDAEKMRRASANKSLVHVPGKGTSGGHEIPRGVATSRMGRAKQTLGKLTGKATEHGKAAVDFVKKHPKKIGGGAALLAGGALAAHAMSKESSAIDILAEKRAHEILAANGVGVSEEEKLASAVEQRAIEMLAAAGYQVE